MTAVHRPRSRFRLAGERRRSRQPNRQNQDQQNGNQESGQAKHRRDCPGKDEGMLVLPIAGRSRCALSLRRPLLVNLLRRGAWRLRRSQVSIVRVRTRARLTKIKQGRCRKGCACTSSERSAGRPTSVCLMPLRAKKYWAVRTAERGRPLPDAVGSHRPDADLLSSGTERQL